MEALLPLFMWDFSSLISDQQLNPSSPALPGVFFATEPKTEEAQRGIFVNVVQLLSTSDSAAP